ncbi:hypothetical protein cypCar_00005113 [Cyprinus carpio]|nr:hypothetical protein cypCar_00005113 [Cyprinus carpio]
MTNGVERLFDQLGHFNRFQACLYFAAIFQAISCGIHYLASVFLVETPKFLCDSPSNITDVLYRNHSSTSLADIWTHYKPGDGPVVVQTAGGDQWELSPCLKALRLDAINFQYEFFGNKTVESCGDFVYDHSEVEQSIVTDWDLVCDKEWLAKLAQPTFMLGVLIGALVFGDIADRIGRRPILMATSLCQFIFGVTVAFTGNYYLFVLMRFLLAMIILTLSTSPFLLYCWKFPETPFYLMAKGRYKEAQELLDTMAYFSGLPPTLKVSELKDEYDGELLNDNKQEDGRAMQVEKRLSILDMFGSLKMAGRSATCWAIWFIGSLGYYVFSLGSVNLGGNQYINLFLAGAVEVPSYLVGCIAMDRVGRKKTCAPALLLGGVACMLIIVVPQDIEILAIVLSMTGKFAIAIAFGLIYLYTCELYPTIIRSLAVGSGSMMCRVGSVVAPFCVYLADVWIYLPQLIVGILAFIIGILTMFLPETLGQPLTSTLEEAEALGSKPNMKNAAVDAQEMNQTIKA